MVEMMMNIGGYCLVNWINYGLSFAGGSVAWRFPLAFQFFFLIILWSTTPWLPESPRFVLLGILQSSGYLTILDGFWPTTEKTKQWKSSVV